MPPKKMNTTDTTNEKTRQTALLVALACVLQISESLFPHPIPGIRLGLANMITLTAMVTIGSTAAMEIAVIRTVLSAIIVGTFMSPTFILSFSGAVISTLVMILLLPISRFKRPLGFSIIGISIAGALTHNMVQLYLAYLLLIKHPGIFLFFPWLCIGAVIMGWITGAVAGIVVEKIETSPEHDLNGIRFMPDPSTDFKPRRIETKPSFLNRIRPEFKILCVVAFSIIVLTINRLEIIIVLFCLPIALIIAANITLSIFLNTIWKYKYLILFSLTLPIFFGSGKTPLLHLHFLLITREGLYLGSLLCLRITFLITMSTLLLHTTSTEDMTRGLSGLLYPLRYFGMSEQRIAGIISASWSAFPIIWDTARNFIRQTNFTSVKDLKNLLPTIGDIIAELFRGTESEDIFRDLLSNKECETVSTEESSQPADPANIDRN